MQGALQKWQLGFWSLCIFLSIICPNCTYMQLFVVPYSFFVFCCSRRCLSRCKHGSKGFQVPGPSLSQHLLSKSVRIYETISIKYLMWCLAQRKLSISVGYTKVFGLYSLVRRVLRGFLARKRHDWIKMCRK